MLTRPGGTPTPVSLPPGIVAISNGTFSGSALDHDGKVWSWGYNIDGQLGDNTVTDRKTPVQVLGLGPVVAIAGASDGCYALVGDGAVRSWGVNSSGELGNGTTTAMSALPVQVKGLSGVTAISADAYNGFALHTDGRCLRGARARRVRSATSAL